MGADVEGEAVHDEFAINSENVTLDLSEQAPRTLR